MSFWLLGHVPLGSCKQLHAAFGGRIASVFSWKPVQIQSSAAPRINCFTVGILSVVTCFDEKLSRHLDAAGFLVWGGFVGESRTV